MFPPEHPPHQHVGSIDVMIAGNKIVLTGCADGRIRVRVFRSRNSTGDFFALQIECVIMSHANLPASLNGRAVLHFLKRMSFGRCGALACSSSG